MSRDKQVMSKHMLYQGRGCTDLELFVSHPKEPARQGIRTALPIGFVCRIEPTHLLQAPSQGWPCRALPMPQWCPTMCLFFLNQPDQGDKHCWHNLLHEADWHGIR